ncbi:MAG: hypothetical protein J5I47_09480, partial [Vicingus serpentipes]|nr:hypothetical protein [Vicingus serpentipes]
MKYFIIFILNFTLISFSVANPPSSRPVIIDDSYHEEKIGQYIEIYRDDNNFSFKEVIEKNEFVLNQTLIPNIGLTPSNIWIRVTVKNKTNTPSLLLDLEYPMLDEVEFFYPDSNGNYSSILLNENYSKERKYKNPDYTFDLNIPKNELKTYYLRVNNIEQIILPLSIRQSRTLWEKTTTKSIINGVYAGIILIMFLYNVFLFLSTQEKSYLFYVIYVLSTGMTHMGIQGYSINYFFSNIKIDGSILTIYASIAGISVIMFTKSFLQTKINAKKLNYGLTALIILFSISLLLSLLGKVHLGFNLMQMSTTVFSIYILIVSYYLLIKGYKPAKFFALSMSILLIGAIIFLLKDFGILPYNNITNYTMQSASAIEMALLSFALADRLNIMRSEKEASQKKTLEVLQENEKIIREQNIVLEQKVEERTTELNRTLRDLKETQAQLVDAEKMSSLGQLTAGIAHEINNPINFVSSNIPPLRQDIEDLNTILSKYEEIETSSSINEKLQEINLLKKELDYDYLKTELKTIINGIEDGAKRTAEIVSGLKNFSRLDEVDLQKTDINEG